MELRVWVDGTQRIVCGVQLTTTCQEIVFALAHATQQAGRFTMIERWRNNERLLSPNEQPLVTLQRWGDRMNEVEFILKKTSTDISANQSANLLQSQQRTAPQAPVSNQAETTQSTVTSGSRRESPNNSASSSTHHSINESLDPVYQQHQYNLNRRSQAVLGSNSINAFGHKFMQPSQQTMNRLPNSFRPSMSTSALPNSSNSMTTSPTMSTSIMRSHYADDQLVNTNSSLMYKLPQNGYSMQNEPQIQQQMTSNSQVDQGQVPIDHSNDLYSTVNKKRVSQPPAVPAKPRVVGQIGSVPNIPVYHPQMQPINNDQMIYYQANQSPLSMYPNILRPRQPPGYLDYMEALASRNPLVQPLMPNPTYAQQSHQSRSNIFQRSIDHQQPNNMPRSTSSPLNSSSTISRLRNSSNPPLNHSNYNPVQDNLEALTAQNVQTTRPKIIESGLIINRGSAVNVKLPSSSQNLASHSSTKSDFAAGPPQSSSTDTSVSQMGHDMLKVIEEQKKVLINQKNELDLLDNDHEYWVTKQNSQQAELIKRIEDEIVQLEDLWKENQAQIKKLENQNFEKELRELRSEQVKMELEISKQKSKLTHCEQDISLCRYKIEQLEQVLNNHDSDLEDASSLSSGEGGKLYANVSTAEASKSLDLSKVENSKSDSRDLRVNGSTRLDDQPNKGSKSSDDDDYEEDSGGDASDDLTLPDNKQRYAKDVYVDKRGLISGIRSLKLDKSRSLNRQLERSNESINSSPTINSLNSKEKAANNNNIIDKRCPETNSQYPEKTANNMFLMTL